MRRKVPNFNKVNILSFSRIIFAFISVMLLLSGDVNLILISFVIMAISEATDLIDGYVARKEEIVTDLGKILDPMSDSISRFLYFFAFAYHGLFPIWFLIIFYLRDIAVAKIRLTSSLSGFVMGARFSGKLKSAVLFVGQYLLLMSLIINSNNFNNQPSFLFLIAIVIIGTITILSLLYFYKIRGWLLYLNLIIMVYLIINVLAINLITIKINYLTTFSIAFFMFAISLYALIDYFFALFHKKNTLLILSFSGIVIAFFFMLTPYSIDHFKNSSSNLLFNQRSTPLSKNENDNKKNIKIWNIADTYKTYQESDKVNNNNKRTISDYLNLDFDLNFYNKNSLIIPILNKFEDNLLEIYLYDKMNKHTISDKPYTYLLSDKIKRVDKLQFYKGYIYILDNLSKKIFKVKYNDYSGKNILNFSFKNNNNIQKSDTLTIEKTMNTGYSSNLSFCISEFNNKTFILLTNYLFSNTIDFVSIGDDSNFDYNHSLVDQISFKLKSEVYINDIFHSDGFLYLKLIKYDNEELLYKLNFQKYIVTKNIHDRNSLLSIIKIPSSTEKTFEHNNNSNLDPKSKILYQLDNTDLYYFNNTIY